jgi:hypothetical protein
MVTKFQPGRGHSVTRGPIGSEDVMAALLVLLTGVPDAWAQIEARSSAVGREETNDSLLSRQVSTLTSENSDLPNNRVRSLALGGDGALWVGTEGGLARYHQGLWQVFNTQNSKLPDNDVQSLALGGDGALWVGTFGGGLARFSPRASPPIVSRLVGQIETVTQIQHLFTASAYDPSYLATYAFTGRG